MARAQVVMSSKVATWQNAPNFDTRTEFVFLSVDVIGHSKLFREDLSNAQLNNLDRRLTRLRDFVESKIPGFAARKDDLQWDWASDGGIFAFPSSEFSRKTTDQVLSCAINIWKELPTLGEDTFSLHISLDRGDAYYVKNKEMRRSNALNTAAKLKSPTGQTAILVTQRIFDDLPEERAKRDFRRHDPVSDGTPVWAYLPALQSGMSELAKRHTKEQQWMEAAHCHYRHARYLLAGDHRAEAAAAFEAAVRAIDAVEEIFRHRYFHRTFRTLYEAWQELAASGKPIPETYPAPKHYFEAKELQDLFRSSDEWSMRGNLMLNLELISEQFELLCAKTLNTPAGLSTLETAIVLQRAGYSRHYFGGALDKRLDKVEQDMKANHCRSIDGDCSLCSGAALSALALAGRHARAHELWAWLRLLGQYDYCHLQRDYTDAGPREHAIHYAANVLQGFLDIADSTSDSEVNAEIANDINHVAAVFFRSKKRDPRRFFSDWMEHRNIDAFEVCTYVMPPFIRYMISERQLSGPQKKHLAIAVRTLADNILEDAANKEYPGRLYAARENVGSFALGLLVGGLDGAGEAIVQHALSIFERRARSDYSERGSETIDSNLDRTRRFLEGWLLQWEAALYARKKEFALPEYVDRRLMRFKRPSEQDGDA